jgi:hypothetical protein
MAMDPDHLLVRDESVDHGLLGGLHGLVDGIKEDPWNETPLVIAAFPRIQGLESRGEGDRISN